MAKKMWHATMLHTQAWGEDRREKGWELFREMERVMEREIKEGSGRVAIPSVALLVTAKRG